MMNKLKALFVEEQGQGMTEYGLVLGVIAVAVVAIIGFMGDEIKSLFEDTFDKIGEVEDKNAIPGTTTTP